MSERDTHFAGFAKLLRDDISHLAVAHHEGKLGNPRDLDEYERLVHLLIAQRAYDLAFHVIETVSYPHLRTVPDITQWPDYSMYPDLPVDHS